MVRATRKRRQAPPPEPEDQADQIVTFRASIKIHHDELKRVDDDANRDPVADRVEQAVRVRILHTGATLIEVEPS
jgi:hypothetical protein